MSSRLPAVLAAILGLGGLALALGRGGLLGWVFAAFLLFAVRVWRHPREGDGRRLAKAVGAVLTGIVLLFVGMVLSWETAEVIVLRQLDERGETFETRLWVIDLRGIPSFAGRAAHEHRRIGLLQEYPKVELVRGGRTECRMARLVSPDVKMGEEAQRLYTEKYGFRIRLASNLVVSLLGGAAEADPVIVQLLPCEE